jgi:hypothetical protein
MKPLLCQLSLRVLTGTVLAAALVVGVSAQPVSVSVPAAKPDHVDQAQDLVAFRTGMTNAKSLAAANNLTGAEQALISLNKARPNTAAWYIDTAQRLMQTAEQLARDAKPASIPALATRALQLLSQAEIAAKTTRTRAAAKALAGFIQERYLANRSAALTAYQGAVVLAPSSPAAKEAVARLQQTEANLQTRRSGGGQ